MGFEYSCFISYTTNGSPLVRRFVNSLCEFLNEELPASAGKAAYLDQERLTAGFIYPEALAEALCRSACMICVYTVPYFGPDHLYCTREFLGMEKLERKRLNDLSQGSGKYKGLIIPLVLRGSNTLPEIITGVRQYESIEDYATYDRDIISNPHFANQLRPVCDYIAERFLELNRIKIDPCCDCSEFKLPSNEEAHDWLNKNISPRKQEFPDFSKSDKE